MTSRQKARHILKDIMPRPVSPEEIKTCDRLEAMITRYEMFIQAIRHADTLLRDGYTAEGIAQVKATMDHHNSLST